MIQSFLKTGLCYLKSRGKQRKGGERAMQEDKLKEIFIKLRIVVYDNETHEELMSQDQTVTRYEMFKIGDIALNLREHYTDSHVIIKLL